ncbi:MAG: putative Fe-S cluster assembly protein SufT [Acidimicrobiales bacterium]
MSDGGPSRIVLQRDCAAFEIPRGEAMLLREGEEVLLVQTLGGSFTVQGDRGYLARIDGSDADALGFEKLGSPSSDEGPEQLGGGFELDAVIEQLKTVFDPEIPINVVDLGLVYECDATPLKDGSHRVEIKMSMTAPGCGMGDILREDARRKVASVPGVREVDIELVWDPPWEMGRMSEAARLQLGLW